jgi:hypothetical protein
MERFLYELDYVDEERFTDNFLVRAMEFSTAVMYFLGEALKYLRANMFKKASIAVVPDSGLKESEKRLLEAVNNFSDAINSETFHVVLKDSEEERYQELVNDISDDSAESSHGDIVALRLEGTGDWFIQKPELKRWIDGVIPRLVCHGHRKMH